MYPGRLAPLLVGAAVRQQLSRTARVQAELSRPEGCRRPAEPVHRGAFHPATAALVGRPDRIGGASL